MRQDSWTIHEAVVLLEKYLQYTSGTITRKEAIESASNKLREMAINQGKQIDITFRNVAGITFQLASMESAYLGYTKLKPATKLFAEIVTTYRTNLGNYKHLLCEANAMIYTHYIEWLKNKVSEDTISSFMRAYNEIDEYCCSINLLSLPLLETTDIDAIKGVQANLLKRSGSATSSATHKLAIQCYIQYLQDCSHWNTNPKRPVPVAEPASTISTDQRNKDSQLRNENPVLYDKLYHTLKDLSARGSWGASALMLYEYVGSSISAVKSILDRASWAEPVGKVYRFSENTQKDAVETDLTIALMDQSQGSELVISAPSQNVPLAATQNISDSHHSWEVSFCEWLKKRQMSDSTVRSYASALSIMEDFAKQNNIPNIVLRSNDYPRVLASIDVLLADKRFIEINTHQHNRFSAAFRKLRDYLAEVARREEQLTSDTALEVKYPKLYRALYSISKVYDDPKGIPISRILALTGLIESKRHVVEFLDNISWAYKLSDGVYSFAKKAAPAPVVVEELKNINIIPKDFDKAEFIAVLMRRFQAGMEFDSIDLEIFRDTYSDLYDEALAFSDSELEERLKLCGVMYKDRIFPADGIIDPSTKERLFAYIDNQFASGSKVLYYKAIFSDLADAFAYCFSLTDETMLKAYLEFVSDAGQFFFTESYISKEANVEVDHATEVVNFMLDAGKPLSYEDIYSGLSHIDKDIIYREIHGNSKFVMNEKEHYFHIDSFEFSQDDGERISAILNKEIDENGYAIWSKAFEIIQEQLPVFLENNLYLSSLGIRNALSQFLFDRFNFEGEVISTHGVRLSMGNVFSLYAKHHAPFTDKQIYEFSKEVGSPIYFWALADESVRVSKSLFVAKDQIHFDVDAVDKALELYLVSGYILLREVDSFLVFPNVGYEWNEYLLESFLLHYSEKYTLVNNGTSLNNVAGAVARKDSEFTQFVDVCAQALADSNVELKRADALNYLAELNLITRRSYKDLDAAMTKARRIRNRKG